MVDLAEASLFDTPETSATEGWGRIESLVQLRWANDRRTLDAGRIGRALIWFATWWGLVPVVEAAAIHAASVWAVLAHVGLVLPWALFVAMRVGELSRRERADVVAAGVMLLAVMVTLLVDHHETDGDHRLFDAVAVLPLVHLGLFVRPRPGVAFATVALGLAAYWAAALGCEQSDVAEIGMAVVLSGVVVVAFVAGLAHQTELDRSHRARIRAELAAHRLTHRADELRVLSEVDPLTGLANRRSIGMRLPVLAERSQSEAETVAVMMIDVDCFKQFNDLYGHQAGDRCLAAVARVVGDQVRRRDDLSGRFGGEEFLAVLPGADLVVAQRVGERIRQAVERLAIPHREGTTGGVVTVSIGCAAGVVDEALPFADILGKADVELYVAKRAGRNRVSPPLEASPDDLADGPLRLDVRRVA
jgi:diguanylate cyclase (GGDEF)-like protein